MTNFLNQILILKASRLKITQQSFELFDYKQKREKNNKSDNSK